MVRGRGGGRTQQQPNPPLRLTTEGQAAGEAEAAEQALQALARGPPAVLRGLTQEALSAGSRKLGGLGARICCVPLQH